MNTKTAAYLILYGAFLILFGALAYYLNPGQAMTALMSGGTFGAFSILWGVLGARGLRWSVPAAKVTTGLSLLVLIFLWRASLRWLAVLDGKPDQLFAASLVIVMLVGTVAMLTFLVSAGNRGAAEPRASPPP